MIRAAVIHQAANLHPHPQLKAALVVEVRSPCSIVMPGFVAPGIVAAFRR
jgi:hypothetical protein